MDLKTRLASLQSNRKPVSVQNLQAESAAKGDVLARLQRSTLARQEAVPAQDERVATVLGGRRMASGVVVIEQRRRLFESLQARDELVRYLSLFVDEGGPPSLDQCVFLDTETTGLAGGTGTLAFLVGVARIEGNDLVLQQWFLTGFGAEAVMLRDLTDWLEAAALVVTFNGKSFDVPLLRSRYCLARLQDPLSRCRHIDLLHFTRRAFASQWPDCRLQTAEQRLLNMVRQDDLPGHLIPEVWTAFVRSGRIGRLPGVIKHNQQDVLSLAVLLSTLLRVYWEPGRASVDAHALARWLRARKRHDLAYEHLRCQSAQLSTKGHLALAEHHRERSCTQDALRIWQRLAAQGIVPAMLSLAKYYEHEVKDYEAALAWTDKMLAKHSASAALLHRRMRLCLRLKRDASAA